MGRYRHVAAVTAQPWQQDGLGCDRIYAYDLQFTFSSGEHQSLAEALGTSAPDTLSYFDHGLPTLVLPPRHRRDLRIVQGSCRKPHAQGYDALPILDRLIGSAAGDPSSRPQQIFFTGDQIYGDDVAEPFLWWASRLGDALLGWREKLPGGYYPHQLKPGERAAIVAEEGGFTAGVGNDEAKVNCHLLGLGEFLATYLLCFSPTCWPRQLPSPPARPAPKAWHQYLPALERFAQGLPYVRRALANIAVYTIFDDHDVSDDWNLNQAWCLRVFGRPLGRRAVQNALLSYALMQGWGNTPEQFRKGQPGARLLQATERWSASGGTDQEAWQQVADCLGIPYTDPLTDLPQFQPDHEHLVLRRPSPALHWSFQLQSPCHQILALDSRTQRGFPAEASPLSPPQLLSVSALKDQLESFLMQGDAQRLTFVIAPTNLFSIRLLDWIQKLHLRRNRVFSTDVGDAWNLSTNSLARFLNILFRHRRRVVVLSGDIHFSSAVRLRFNSNSDQVKSGVLVQLTASAIANEEPLTRLIHTVLKHWLLPESSRHWIGYLQPDQMREVSKGTAAQTANQADWQCTLDWMERQKTQRPNFNCQADWIPAATQWQPLKLWQARWLQEGREFVGRNNLAIVQFAGDHIQQDCYWYAPWQQGMIVRSRFESPLELDPD